MARLSDAELLAVTLRVGSGSFQGGAFRKSANDLVLSLLKEFRGLDGIDRAYSEELRKVPGLGPAKIAQIETASESAAAPRSVAAVAETLMTENSLFVANKTVCEDGDDGRQYRKAEDDHFRLEPEEERQESRMFQEKTGYGACSVSVR